MANGNAGRSFDRRRGKRGMEHGGTSGARSKWGPRSAFQLLSLAPYAVGTEFRTVEKGLRGEKGKEREGEREKERERVEGSDARVQEGGREQRQGGRE